MINILTEGAYLDYEVTEDIEPYGIIFNYQFFKFSLFFFLVIIFFLWWDLLRFTPLASFKCTYGITNYSHNSVHSMPYLHGLFILYLEIYTFCLPLLILPTSHPPPLATIICSDELSFFKKKKELSIWLHQVLVVA